MKHHYADYSAEDFVLDTDFRTWVLHPDAQSNQLWEQWLMQHPHKKEIIEEARLMVLTFQIREETLGEESVQKAWANVQQKYIHNDVFQKKQLPQSISVYWSRVAAVLVFVLLAGVIAWLVVSRLGNDIHYATTYGETKTLHLPEGSVVTLNANSKLSFAKEWHTGKAREVWLEGEAFFSIRKKPGAASARFIVHTSNLNVEVLGTSFNIKERKGFTRVVLNTGKVKLAVADTDTKEVYLTPGESAEFSNEDKKLIKKNVNPEYHSSWKHHKLIFNNTTMKEVAQIIEEIYGLQVSFEDETTSQRILNGTLPTDNKDAFLNALSATLRVEIKSEGNTLVFKK